MFTLKQCLSTAKYESFNLGETASTGDFFPLLLFRVVKMEEAFLFEILFSLFVLYAMQRTMTGSEIWWRFVYFHMETSPKDMTFLNKKKFDESVDFSAIINDAVRIRKLFVIRLQ